MVMQRFACAAVPAATVAAASVAFSQIKRRSQPACAEPRTQTSSHNLGSKQSCVVIGSGVIGLTTAYYLQRRGLFERLHVVDRREDCALNASFQNGGVINVESIAPVNSYMTIPGTFIQSFLHMLGFGDTNTLITWRALLEPPGLLLRWMWYFYQNVDDASIQRNAAWMLELGTATSQLFQEAASHLGLNEQCHNFKRTPGLVLSHATDPEATVAEKQARFGSVKHKHYIFGEDLEAVKKESGLEGLECFNFNLGCIEPNNFTINTRSFCKKLEQYLKSHGVMFHYCSQVDRLVVNGAHVNAVTLTNGQCLDADCFVMCAGYETCYLLQNVGVQVPLAPVKAYSLHIKDSVIAPELKYAAHLDVNVSCLITPYRDLKPAAVRVTGIRDLDGFNTITRADRVQALLEAASCFVGSGWNAQHVDVWSGVMAVSPNDLPIVGNLEAFENLFVNIGHGFRGTNWSLACAKLLSEVIANDGGTSIDQASMSPARYGV